MVMVNNQYMRVCGIDDLNVGRDEWNKQITKCEECLGDDIYSILLTHRPEQVMRYHGYDLIVSGHTQGGVFQIPYILNGLYAEDQGWFPEYAGGRYEFDEKTMIVSRGLSKPGFKKIFIPPEIVIINIKGNSE